MTGCAQFLIALVVMALTVVSPGLPNLLDAAAAERSAAGLLSQEPARNTGPEFQLKIIHYIGCVWAEACDQWF
jgi:hypothetical protein